MIPKIQISSSIVPASGSLASLLSQSSTFSIGQIPLAPRAAEPPPCIGMQRHYVRLFSDGLHVPLKQIFSQIQHSASARETVKELARTTSIQKPSFKQADLLQKQSFAASALFGRAQVSLLISNATKPLYPTPSKRNKNRLFSDQDEEQQDQDQQDQDDPKSSQMFPKTKHRTAQQPKLRSLPLSLIPK